MEAAAVSYPQFVEDLARALLVAIDGPAGAGKSTVARAVARELGFTYLDSGAMYRCVALLALAEPDADAGAAGARARASSSAAPDEVLLDGRDVTGEIRTPAVSARGLHRRARRGGARGAGGDAARADRDGRLGGRGARHRHGRCAGRGREGLSHGQRAASVRAAVRPSSARTRRRCWPSRRCATSATPSASTARCARAEGAVTAGHDGPGRRAGGAADRRARTAARGGGEARGRRRRAGAPRRNARAPPAPGILAR